MAAGKIDMIDVAKTSCIVIEKDVTFGNKTQWNAQFDWIIEVMLKMKKAFKKYF